MAGDVPFSCVPVGTRNHFAMDLGLDRSHPLQSLDAALDGVEKRSTSASWPGGSSSTTCPRALPPSHSGPRVPQPQGPEHGRRRGRHGQESRNPDHPHRARWPNRLRHRDAAPSNNPYSFIGPPDFARRPALDTGTLGIILADRGSRLNRRPAAFTRWETQKLTVHVDPASIQVGVDGELRQFQAPVDVAITPKSLRVLVPIQTQSRGLKESIDQLNERAVVHLGGLPTLPSRDEVTARSPLIRRLGDFDEEVFERLAGWESPAMDRIMPVLSQAASHSKIWIAMAAAMSFAGGKKGRRTAVESLAAVGITSFLANLVAKGFFRRRRPTDPVPEAASLPTPGSSSMPSGHTASAAAFSRVVGAAYPSADPTQCPRRRDRVLPGLHRSAPPHRCHIRLAPRERDRNAHPCNGCDGCYCRSHSSLSGQLWRHRMMRRRRRIGWT